LKALCELALIRFRSLKVSHGRHGAAKFLVESFLPDRSAPPVSNHKPGCPSNKGCYFFWLAKAASAQRLDCDEENLMGEIGSSLLISQVPEAIQPDPRSQPSVELVFRIARLAWSRG
jgi:hypothetical protein